MIIDKFRTDMQGRQIIDKPAVDVLDYSCDLSPYLAYHNTTLISAVATVDNSATIMQQSTTGGSLWQAWISGGTPGRVAKIALRVQSVGSNGVTRDDTMFAYLNIL